MLVRRSILERHWAAIVSATIGLLILLSFVSLSVGVVPISFGDVVAWMFGEDSPQTAVILTNIRLPRILLAILVGALLASCGAVTQGLFRNPLADPSLIGVSAGASAGASISIVLFSHVSFSLFGFSLVFLSAFLGGLLAVLFVYRISTSAYGTSITTMLLAGIAITFFAGSISSTLEFIADHQMLRQISLWRMGGFDQASYGSVAAAFVMSLLLLGVFPRYTKGLNVLLLGESEARHLGANVKALKRNLIIAVAAGVGVSVALVGTIAFVGLVVPHFVRIIVGPNHKYLLPLSALSGAILLVAADVIARTIFAPTELPVGLITSFIGAPVFILMLRKKYQYGV